MTQRVLVDASIFFSRTLTDWVFLLREHTGEMFQVFATEDAISEAIAAFRDKNPTVKGSVTAGRAALVRENLDEIIGDFPSGLSFTGTDIGDYHLHAAAHAGRADFVLTSNDPRDITARDEPYEVIHPDAFFALVAQSAPAELLDVVQRQARYWGKKEHSLPLDEALRRAGCPDFAGTVRKALQDLAHRPG
ncbi:MAG: PIN domain-containing protein [Kocuria sp.]|nr:PIN domain-containing protein [Kocuria sp.]